MFASLLALHIIIAIALVVVVLLQRSEGGALGIGGGGGGFMSGRAAADALTRTTTILATAFFLSSIGLTIVGAQDHTGGSVVPDAVPSESSSDSVPDLQKSPIAPLPGDQSAPAPAPAQPEQPDVPKPE